MQDEIALGKNERQLNYGILSQDIYSVADLAAIIGVHPTTILAQIKTGKLKALGLGGPAGYRIHKSAVLNWIGAIHNDPSL